MQQLKELFEALTPEQDEELADLFDSDAGLAINRVVELAAEQGIQVTTDDVNAFLAQLPDPETSVSLDQFKTLKQSISPEIEQEITSPVTDDYILLYNLI